ncbi:glycoside hydrolase [Phakopsora pachyrhizi]|uniref:alpha-1,2-Mannosidase n=1 Tax=Phakopsora pachyrhizi TaxID=170000 RepID=A0AAV0ALL2_PHAPC|nr:glycoside hydrolase [Phakopsora pachyrhizi]CAH7669632.1 glycoside hydrolase [Phakopsora pachyrhizi]CAH7687589.1 glycoside hydrolase [Phakopsora pachyrhizi]
MGTTQPFSPKKRRFSRKYLKTRNSKRSKSPISKLTILLFVLVLSLIYFRKPLLTRLLDQEKKTQVENASQNIFSNTISKNSESRSAIVRAIKDSWSAYAKSEAWGSDEFHVLSGKGGNLTSGGSIGFFIVDVIDTILLTKEMDSEYLQARNYVEKSLSFEIDGFVNAFETTIRVLGGLLSAYHLSGNDTLYLDKAIDLGDRLLPIFNTKTGIPYSFINLKTGEARPDGDNHGYSSLAEATSLQLEFKYLAELSQNPVYWDVAERAMMSILNQPSRNGLLPILVSPQDASFYYHIRLGSRGDSYYEYLIKQYLQTGRSEPFYRKSYDRAMIGIKQDLIRESPNGWLYTGELHPWENDYKFVPKQDHLVCFLGGSFLLGVTEGRKMTEEEVSKLEKEAQYDWYIGKELIKTCVNTYNKSATGLGAEIVNFIEKPNQSYYESTGRDWYINRNSDTDNPPLDARNILRPETVESLFLGWRTTGDPIYREWGWQIFEAFNKHCRVNSTGAFSSILDVDQSPAKTDDKMETFWIAETLKYLLLLFSDDDSISLNSHVFNTEAHIFPIFQPTIKNL